MIAKLIYKSQTACYARDRDAAIDELGDNYNCVCNPEIMVAMIYALNDEDEDVREEAADEIGDQLVKNPCCCSKEVVAALKAALSDCDKSVRREAEEALEACGYCIVGGCCNGCHGCCGRGAGKAGEPVPAAPMDDKAAPAPMPPPADPKAYIPSRLRPAKPLRSARRSPLADLFGLFD